MPDTIIHGRIQALVEAAEASLRADPWPHLARLQTEHDTLWAALARALASDDADVFVRLALAQGRPERVARLLGTTAAWFDARRTSIGQTERADHDRSIVATRVHLGDEIVAPA